MQPAGWIKVSSLEGWAKDQKLVSHLSGNKGSVVVVGDPGMGLTYCLTIPSGQ